MDFKKKSKRKGSLDSAGLVLQSLLQNSKSELSDQFLRWKVWNLWPQIVGPTLAKCSQPVGYNRGRLYIWVDHSARLQELNFLSEELRRKINESVGKKWIHSIRFTLDRKEIPLDSEGQRGLRSSIEQSTSSSRFSKDEDQEK